MCNVILEKYYERIKAAYEASAFTEGILAFLIYIYFFCICFSNFTILSLFFAVFIKVGRWSD